MQRELTIWCYICITFIFTWIKKDISKYKIKMKIFGLEYPQKQQFLTLLYIFKWSRCPKRNNIKLFRTLYGIFICIRSRYKIISINNFLFFRTLHVKWHRHPNTHLYIYYLYDTPTQPSAIIVKRLIYITDGFGKWH